MKLLILVAIVTLQLIGRVWPGSTDCPNGYAIREISTKSIQLGPLEPDGAVVSFEYSGFRFHARREHFSSTLQGSNTQPRLILKDRELHGLYRWLNEQPPGDDVELRDYGRIDEELLAVVIVELAKRFRVSIYDVSSATFQSGGVFETYQCVARDDIRLEGIKVDSNQGDFVLRLVFGRKP